MLRRPPTVISLTGDDIAAYEESRLARMQARMAAAGQQSQKEESSSPYEPSNEAHGPDPNDELKPFPGDRSRAPRYAPAASSAGNASAEASGAGAASGHASTAAAAAAVTPSGPSQSAGASGSPRAPQRTRDQRIGLTR